MSKNTSKKIAGALTAVALFAGVAFAGAHHASAQVYGQSSLTGSTGSSSVSPGVPNTGFGGESTMNWIALLGSGLVAAAGITYLARYATGQ